MLDRSSSFFSFHFIPLSLLYLFPSFHRYRFIIRTVSGFRYEVDKIRALLEDYTVQETLDLFTFEIGTDSLSRNVGKEFPPEEPRSHVLYFLFAVLASSDPG
jgi:hypothetical protein